MAPAHALALLAGLVTIVAAILDWDWFFNGAKARFFVEWLGRDGARVFYGLLGCAIVGLSFCL